VVPDAAVVSGPDELALQIRSNLEVPDGHPWISVAEKFHERGYGFTPARVISLAQLRLSWCGTNAGGDAGRSTGFMQIEAQLAVDQLACTHATRHGVSPQERRIKKSCSRSTIIIMNVVVA
jgi:hypothetical protein